jgi:hypothetical protein
MILTSRFQHLLRSSISINGMRQILSMLHRSNNAIRRPKILTPSLQPEEATSEPCYMPAARPYRDTPDGQQTAHLRPLPRARCRPHSYAARDPICIPGTGGETSPRQRSRKRHVTTRNLHGAVPVPNHPRCIRGALGPGRAGNLRQGLSRPWDETSQLFAAARIITRTRCS